jgi:putative MATE family efflux protein
LGVVGSPLATAITMALGITGLLVWLERGDSPFALSRMWRYLGIDWPLLGQLVRIGVPTGVQFVMASLAEIAVISFVNGFGFKATAAYGAVNQVVSYVQFPAISIGIAGSIFGAQAIGAGRLDRLPKIVRAAVTLNYVIGGVLIGIAYLLSHEILSLFITDPSTLGIAQGLLHITLWSYVIFGNSAVLSGLMRSSGSVLWPTTISILSIWLVEVPTAWALSRGPLGLSGVWYAYPVTYFTSLTFQSIYYFFFWRRRPIKALHEKTAAASA